MTSCLHIGCETRTSVLGTLQENDGDSHQVFPNTTAFFAKILLLFVF
ncbi:MAG TPA: hypothetical protein VF681_06820 [Abditibacteriaceae bacterium]